MCILLSSRRTSPFVFDRTQNNQAFHVVEQDLIILGMKAHQVAAIVRDLPAIMGLQTTVLTVQNGIPWWYFFKHGGPYEGIRLESVNPGGVIADNLPLDRVIASVVYPAAEIERPGVIRHIEGNRFSLAEIDGSKSERIRRVSESFREGRIQGAGRERRTRRDMDDTAPSGRTPK